MLENYFYVCNTVIRQTQMQVSLQYKQKLNAAVLIPWYLLWLFQAARSKSDLFQISVLTALLYLAKKLYLMSKELQVRYCSDEIEKYIAICSTMTLPCFW